MTDDERVRTKQREYERGSGANYFMRMIHITAFAQ